MTRLIDADAIEYHVVWKELWLPNGSRYAKAVFKDEIDEAQTVDAVQVIRCGNCKWYSFISDGYGYCKSDDGSKAFVYSNDYCSRAERKTDDKTD